MKKLFAILLALTLVLAFAACGEDTPATTDPQAGTQPQLPPQPTYGTAATNPVETKTFAFTFEGVQLIPGAVFDASALPQAAGVSQVPSCAFEGTDNAYNYETFELTAYNDGSGEVIYSIYLLDPNTPTDEGLYLGDDFAQATMFYGDEYEENGTQITYTRGTTQLILILQDNVVTSIEYRMAQ